MYILAAPVDNRLSPEEVGGRACALVSTLSNGVDEFGLGVRPAETKGNILISPRAPNFGQCLLDTRPGTGSHLEVALHQGDASRHRDHDHGCGFHAETTSGMMRSWQNS